MGARPAGPAGTTGSPSRSARSRSSVPSTRSSVAPSGSSTSAPVEQRRQPADRGRLGRAALAAHEHAADRGIDRAGQQRLGRSSWPTTARERERGHADGLLQSPSASRYAVAQQLQRLVRRRPTARGRPPRAAARRSRAAPTGSSARRSRAPPRRRRSAAVTCSYIQSSTTPGGGVVAEQVVDGGAPARTRPCSRGASSRRSSAGSPPAMRNTRRASSASERAAGRPGRRSRRDRARVGSGEVADVGDHPAVLFEVVVESKMSCSRLSWFLTATSMRANWRRIGAARLARRRARGRRRSRPRPRRPRRGRRRRASCGRRRAAGCRSRRCRGAGRRCARSRRASRPRAPRRRRARACGRSSCSSGSSRPGDQRHRVVEQVDEVREGVAEEAGDAHRDVDPRPAQLVQRDHLEAGRPGASPGSSAAGRRAARGSRPRRRPRCASPPCPRRRSRPSRAAAVLREQRVGQLRAGLVGELGRQRPRVDASTSCARSAARRAARGWASRTGRRARGGRAGRRAGCRSRPVGRAQLRHDLVARRARAARRTPRIVGSSPRQRGTRRARGPAPPRGTSTSSVPSRRAQARRAAPAAAGSPPSRPRSCSPSRRLPEDVQPAADLRVLELAQVAVDVLDQRAEVVGAGCVARRRRGRGAARPRAAASRCGWRARAASPGRAPRRARTRRAAARAGRARRRSRPGSSAARGGRSTTAWARRLACVPSPGSLTTNG